ncbi:Gfo/Idh/MocA family oxidoreductase [Flavihumibacter sp. UBA7668]|uniref:Gfo/Idh/MocA family oxidoreductase n=1 Tax=Flavihumibacter sp. UBA7668 TaxID=1946542 RepID=UPI0025C608C0|nr:Gfo/Idh/MocA family oxidoreductase [Flavihumibacter sp. UBA7668]
MSTFKYIGLIATQQLEMPILLSTGSIDHGYKLKKVLAQQDLTTGLAESWYPGVEVVGNLSEILEDENIELVVVAGKSDNHLDIIRQATEAGKFVRVI